MCLCAVSRYLQMGVPACWVYGVHFLHMFYGGVCEYWAVGMHGCWVLVSVRVDVCVLEVLG